MRQFVERMTCDRCGWFEDIRPKQPNNWTVLVKNREDKEQHLCEACHDQFKEWWSGK